MKSTISLSVRTLVLVGIVALVALGVMTTTPSSAQPVDEDAPWVLYLRTANKEKAKDDAYLLNVKTGDLYLVEGNRKYQVILKDSAGKKK